ncbi:hypothetical protein [Sulfidibacter corallicola]|uniref:Uncharacterized protein n=1 Tax=Sulfidibacter corallicola TaxID=2818388 RepID=A0A8A4TJR1_SULCO|nr:hypothetical protein [Sulfidibacter corallicola]QTD49048.1 hypothetical protein J3U87_25970 [Sulfidibacter corallicola]
MNDDGSCGEIGCLQQVSASKRGVVGHTTPDARVTQLHKPTESRNHRDDRGNIPMTFSGSAKIAEEMEIMPSYLSLEKHGKMQDGVWLLNLRKVER